MGHIAIIPARAGSKSIINKNLQNINGKSLIERTIASAKKAKFFSSIILTTDIPVLLDNHTDGVVKIRRQEDLCKDNTLMNDVMKDVFSTGIVADNDYVWLLQPTSPFRETSHFKDILTLIESQQPRSVISVKDVGAYHPNRTYMIRRGSLHPIRYTNFDNKQNLKPIFIRNGCFYVFRAAEFKETGTFFIQPCIPYVMDEEHSINIDGPFDLILAKAIHEHGGLGVSWRKDIS